MGSSSAIGRCVIGLLLGAIAVQAQTYTNAFPGLTFSRPLWMEEIPSKAGHYLVMEQVGSAQVVTKQGNAWTKSEFVKISVLGGVTPSGNEQGLLGFAFHPQYATNRKYYLYYCTSAGGDAQVIEERVADATLLKDAGGQGRSILRIDDFAGNHNGGGMGFGPDGFLYLGTGDGGNQNDPRGNGQNKNALLAKMLRIDVNRQENGKQYGIPSDNPFVGGGGAPEVYAYGFRNPYRWAFDPVTKDLWVADVGGIEMEEVDIVQKGGNYGWRISEGTLGLTSGIKRPVFAYGRSQGTCIIGGYVFRGNPASKFHGQFIFGDYGSRNMWAASKLSDSSATTTSLAKPPAEPRGFGTDNQGRLYIMAGTSTVYLMGGTDFSVSSSTSIPGNGRLKQAIGCIFSCRPGSRLDPKAFEAGRDLDILSLGGERLGRISRTDGAVPAGLEAGLYILKSGQSAKPNLLMVR